MQIAVRADLVTGIGDPLDLVREGLDRVAGDEEAGLEIVFLEQVQQADTPTSLAKMPRWMSDGESPPP